MLPRIPLTKETADYKKFTMAGRALVEWHLNYETNEAYPLAEISPELGLDPWKQFLKARDLPHELSRFQPCAGRIDPARHRV